MTITIVRIQKLVAEHYKSDIRDMTTRRRGSNECMPRMVAMYLSRMITGKSFPEIGAYFSKHHTTVMNAYERVGAMISAAPDIEHDIETLLNRIMLDVSTSNGNLDESKASGGSTPLMPATIKMGSI